MNYTHEYEQHSLVDHVHDLGVNLLLHTFLQVLEFFGLLADLWDIVLAEVEHPSSLTKLPGLLRSQYEASMEVREHTSSRLGSKGFAFQAERPGLDLFVDPL